MFYTGFTKLFFFFFLELGSNLKKSVNLGKTFINRPTMDRCNGFFKKFGLLIHNLSFPLSGDLFIGMVFLKTVKK